MTNREKGRCLFLLLVAVAAGSARFPPAGAAERGVSCREGASPGLEIRYRYRRLGGQEPGLSAGAPYDERGWERVVWTEGHLKKVKWIESEIPDPSLAGAGEASSPTLESLSRFMSGRERVRIERTITRVRAPGWRYTVTDTLIGGRHDIRGRVRYHRKRHRPVPPGPPEEEMGGEIAPGTEIAGIPCRMERTALPQGNVVERCVARLMGKRWDLLYRKEAGGSLLAGAELEKIAEEVEVGVCIPLDLFEVPDPPPGARWRVSGSPPRR